MAFRRWWNWAVMAVRGRLLIKVPVGCHGQSSEVVVGHHCCLTMVVLASVNVGGRSSPFVDRGGGSWWPIVHGCGGHLLFFVGAVRRE